MEVKRKQKPVQRHEPDKDQGEGDPNTGPGWGRGWHFEQMARSAVGAEEGGGANVRSD